ncbi:hypothetical protein BDV10DRAFT_140226 [Aspergillus recurvatus]
MQLPVSRESRLICALSKSVSIQIFLSAAPLRSSPFRFWRPGGGWLGCLRQREQKAGPCTEYGVGPEEVHTGTFYVICCMTTGSPLRLRRNNVPVVLNLLSLSSQSKMTSFSNANSCTALQTRDHDSRAR